MKKLISMTEFVINQWSVDLTKSQRERIKNYADFLSQKLSIDMLVPCKLVDGVWVIIEVPKDWKNWEDVYIANNKEGKTKNRYTSQLNARRDCLEYQEAKERCLFEGFEIGVPNSPVTAIYPKTINNGKLHVYWYNTNLNSWVKPTKSSSELETIEDLVKYNLQLTASAQKQIEG